MTISWNFILRLFIAGVLGGLIGFEREFRAKEAGLRTHFIVALGSALFMIISQYAFSGRFDTSRVAAQVVSGIGFIGAGVIIFQKNSIRGITTASGLWVAAAIGLATGAGMYDVAIAATLFTIICLETMHFVTKKHGDRCFTLSISPIKNEDVSQLLDKIKSTGKGTVINSINVADDSVTIRITTRQKQYPSLISSIMEGAGNYHIEIE